MCRVRKVLVEEIGEGCLTEAFAKHGYSLQPYHISFSCGFLLESVCQMLQYRLRKQSWILLRFKNLS